MGIIDRLLGKRKPTTAALADEVTKQEAAVAESRARIGRTKAERQAAIEAFDDARHRAADEEIAAAGRDIERREHAIEALKVAHAERVEADTREAFRREVDEATRAAEALSHRVRHEYEPAAVTLAALVRDLRLAHHRAERLVARGRELGEPVNLPNPEGCRRSIPARWSATWPDPNPEAVGFVQGPPENAPHGSIRWEDGSPIAVREGVSVRLVRPITYPVTLFEAIGHVPALHAGDPDHVAGKPVAIEARGR